MIDANAGNGSVAHHLKKPLVDCLKDLRVFDSDRGQLVYIEKTAVIDFFGSHPPVAEAIGLGAQEFVQSIKRSGIADSTLKLIDRAFDRVAHLRTLGTQSSDTPLDDFF